ncbi:MAG: metallophosphoesterase [Dysgonamonadaceae bacterium]|jgi:mannan endo-1,4-beta-mannosidase|nr:metallophosphoesterase [Dysgonamonadaceae bacterium]
MNGKLKITGLGVLLFFAANNLLAADNCPDSLRKQAVDKKMTDETAALLYNLHNLQGKGTLAGQHDGVWIAENGRLASWISNLTGKLPGIVGYDFMHITNRQNTEGSWHRKRENEIREKIIACNEQGLYVTMCWHYNDPYTGKTFYTKELSGNLKKKSFRSILEGGEKHDVYKKDLRKIAEFAASLRDKNGKWIPFIFRPFHELDGEWFWWGANYNTPEEFQSLWRFTVTYLRDSLQVHNLLYAFSPDIKFDSREQYLLRYPGDEYVDILGFDDYGDFKQGKKDIDKAKRRIGIVGALAKEKKKPAALTETGYFILRDKTRKNDLECVKGLLETVSEMHDRLAYVAFWSNGGHDYCMPQQGNTGEMEFMDFFKQAFWIFNRGKNAVFQLALLPDVQTYTKMYPEIFKAQTQWLADNKNDFAFVLQQGDITDWNAPEQWERAREAFSVLDGKLPYTFVPGNHDTGNNADVRNTENLNHYLPYDKYSKTPNFGGAFQPGKMDNTWHIFRAGGIDWLILSLEFGTRDCVLEWAGKIIGEHPRHKIIINTHDYMYSDDTRMGEGDDWLPQTYGVGKETGKNAVNDGEQMWAKLVSRYENILLVVSGHVLHSGTGTLVSRGVHGNNVYQMLANYQEGVKDTTSGGNGFMRILTIDVENKTIDVKTYSPYVNQYKIAENQQFVFQNVQF